MRVLIGVIAASAMISVAVSATPAKAGCHLVDCVEDVFVKPQEIADRRCEDLWVLRNAIYQSAGYCFRSERARRTSSRISPRFPSTPTRSTTSG